MQNHHPQGLTVREGGFCLQQKIQAFPSLSLLRICVDPCALPHHPAPSMAGRVRAQGGQSPMCFIMSRNPSTPNNHIVSLSSAEGEQPPALEICLPVYLHSALHTQVSSLLASVLCSAGLLPCSFKKCVRALDCVAQWIERWPVNRKVAGLIPCQGTCLGCEPGAQLGVCERQPIGVFLPPFSSL